MLIPRPSTIVIFHMCVSVRMHVCECLCVCVHACVHSHHVTFLSLVHALVSYCDCMDVNI